MTRRNTLNLGNNIMTSMISSMVPIGLFVDAWLTLLLSRAANRLRRMLQILRKVEEAGSKRSKPKTSYGTAGW